MSTWDKAITVDPTIVHLIPSINRNYRQTWHLNSRMKIMVSGIVEVSMNKIALWISVRVDDWSAEISIIAMNVTRKMLRLKVCLRQLDPGKYKPM